MLFLLSKVSKDMHQSIVPILFSLLESHASGAEFMRSNQKWKEMYGMMGNLVADRRRREGQLSGLAEEPSAATSASTTRRGP